MTAALSTSGRAVVFAGTTVVTSLLGLLLVDLPYITGAAVGAIIVVFLVMTAAVTLLPAALGAFGSRVAEARIRLRRTLHTRHRHPRPSTVQPAPRVWRRRKRAKEPGHPAGVRRPSPRLRSRDERTTADRRTAAHRRRHSGPWRTSDRRRAHRGRGSRVATTCGILRTNRGAHRGPRERATSRIDRQARRSYPHRDRAADRGASHSGPAG
jgi:hypothetical protein